MIRLLTCVKVEEKMLQDFHHELGIMKKLHHPHVVLLMSHFHLRPCLTHDSGACTKDVSNLLIGPFA